jgi:putative ubiquitin-RnfH superfamily antitoxin RatB of RatAB toxin-antitoxin module
MEKVELVYVDQNQRIIHQCIELKPRTTLEDLLRESGIWTTHPETKAYAVGIYSKPASLDTVLKSGDRIEIYRPLASDPKEKRRRRVVTL